MRVTLDNGEAISCTPDHRFMARDGAWAEAAGLAPDSSLMPFYKKLDRDGYVLICQPYSGRWQRAHWAIARAGALGAIHRFRNQRAVIHHKDFDRTNNDPANLAFLGEEDHARLHRQLAERNARWRGRHGPARRTTQSWHAAVPAPPTSGYCTAPTTRRP